MSHSLHINSQHSRWLETEQQMKVRNKFLSIVIFWGNKWDLQFSSEICKHFKCKQACSTVNTFEMLWHCKLNMNSICIQYICVQYCTLCLLLSKFLFCTEKKITKNYTCFVIIAVTKQTFIFIQLAAVYRPSPYP